MSEVGWRYRLTWIAHVDYSKSCPGGLSKRFWNTHGILAAEATDTNCLQRSQPRPSWSLVLGSDSHHPDGSFGDRFPGSHYTWVKMGTPSIEGLRLALIDGNPLSVLRSDEDVGDPNEYASQVIESITIRDARYAGRPEPLEGHFSPWMTAIVGGRGTGKSTIVEMLRLALRRQDDLPDELQSDFNQFASLPESRNDPGALTENSEAVATVRKDDARFRVRWRYDGTGDFGGGGESRWSVDAWCRGYPRTLSSAHPEPEAGTGVVP